MLRYLPAGFRVCNESPCASRPQCTYGSCLSWNKSSSMSALRRDQPFSWPLHGGAGGRALRRSAPGCWTAPAPLASLRAAAVWGEGAGWEQPTRQSRRGRQETAARVGGEEEEAEGRASCKVEEGGGGESPSAPGGWWCLLGASRAPGVWAPRVGGTDAQPLCLFLGIHDYHRCTILNTSAAVPEAGYVGGKMPSRQPRTALGAPTVCLAAT